MIGKYMKRNVISIPSTATIREAAAQVVRHHIGLLPVVDDQGKLVGVVDLRDLLTIELPDFFDLVEDLDFVHISVQWRAPVPPLNKLIAR